MRRWWTGSVLIAGMAAASVPTTENAMTPLYQKTYDRATLAHDFPPVVRDANKRIVLEIAYPPGTVDSGEITISRWSAMPLPAQIPGDAKTAFEARPDFFTYDPPGPHEIVWHLNFAAHDLFHYYGSGLMAQDELQVAEHPLLGSLREALLHDHFSTLVVDAGSPTPILITGAPRRVRISTNKNAAAGRKNGLYGNNFSYASTDAIRKATERLDPPTLSNIIAIEAPAEGPGEYTAAQLRFILETAYTGDRAAVIQSASVKDPLKQVIIHTGFWGCGAYGGNRTVMTALQLLAAREAGVDRLVFHTGDTAGIADYERGKKLFAEAGTGDPATDQAIDRIHSHKFRWGTSDGN